MARKFATVAISAPILPRAGSRIGIVCGPGEFPQDTAGTVLCHVEDRWGVHAVALMDDGTTRKVHGVTDRGIGVYQL